MMRREFRAMTMGTALAAAVAGCGGNDERAEGSHPVSITMERNACFGRCPVYRLDISDSGKVVYEGRGFVQERGRHEATIPAEDVQALAKEIEAAGFFSLRDNYPPDATDHATVITSVTIDRKTKRVEHNLGSTTAPAALEALYRRIDEVARSKQWVGDAPAPRPGEKGGGADTARRDTAVR